MGRKLTCQILGQELVSEHFLNQLNILKDASLYLVLGLSVFGDSMVGTLVLEHAKHHRTDHKRVC